MSQPMHTDDDYYPPRHLHTVTITFKVSLERDRNGGYEEAMDRTDAEVACAMKFLDIKDYDVQIEW